MYALIIPKDINKQLDKLGNKLKSRILAKLILLKDYLFTLKTIAL